MVEEDEVCKRDRTMGGRRRQRRLIVNFRRFKQSVFVLETEFDRLEIAMKHRGENPVISLTKLFVGMIFGLTSMLWIMHILLYIMLRPNNDKYPVTTFLNEWLIDLEDQGLFVLAACLYAGFTIYLMFCVVKGCLKIGMRAFCLFEIHPMKAGATPLNSMLFNCIMVLFSTCAIIQFSMMSFKEYAGGST